jgi:hypothetical protein
VGAPLVPAGGAPALPGLIFHITVVDLRLAGVFVSADIFDNEGNDGGSDA